MGYRLSKIYTKTGDQGETGLGDNQRVPKDHPRVEAYGAVDELNSVIGLLLTQSAAPPVREALTRIQHDLFDLGGELCLPGHALIEEAHVKRLETAIDRMNAELAPLQEFILPGGSPPAAWAHLARTVCRRAERRVATLMREEKVRDLPLKYLNRLSDYLFVLARHLNKTAGQEDVLWKR
jgi:cob(I)alamin adenosyltransferase